MSAVDCDGADIPQDTLLFRSGINYDDPITKYLPSLANKDSLTAWEDITLGALAGQVAGIVPNCEAPSDITPHPNPPLT